MHRNVNKLTSDPIDFVIAWVDGNDPDWRKRKNEFLGSASTDERTERYRDWGLLRYWFRSVEGFAPWVNKVWFICDQAPPEWLNARHPKLRIVRHEDYIPKEYLPAFSSHPIELNMHRIKGLSEKFVYFNDDMFLLAPVESSFFFRNGLPCDSAVLNPIPTDDLVEKGETERIFTMFLNNASYINREYDFKSCVREHPSKWLHPSYGRDLIRNMMLMMWPHFVGFVENHLPQAFLKSSFESAWEKNADILDATSRHHIRDDRDVNQWFIRNRQLAEGRFIPCKPQRHLAFELNKDDERMHNTIRRQAAPMICLHDGQMTEEETARIGEKIKADFESILGEKSGFELC